VDYSYEDSLLGTDFQLGCGACLSVCCWVLGLGYLISNMVTFMSAPYISAEFSIDEAKKALRNVPPSKQFPGGFIFRLWDKIWPGKKDGTDTIGPIYESDYGEYNLIKFVPSVLGDHKYYMCQLAHGAYARDPVHLPFFNDLVRVSGCGNFLNVKIWNHDEALEYLNSMRIVQPTGFLFHSGRVGSTLASNILALDNATLVYSEAQPIVEASFTWCRYCKQEERIDVLRTVVGLMGASETHQRLFFKMHPASAAEIELFRQAFPDTAFVYFHRDPVEVMMSQLKKKKPPKKNSYKPASSFGFEEAKRPPCLRPLDEVDNVLGLRNKNADATREEYCAVYLAVLNKQAIKHTERTFVGMPVAYDQHYFHKLMTVVYPHHFGVPIEADFLSRAKKLAGLYSKQRVHKSSGGLRNFTEDISSKHKGAWPELIQYSKQYLEVDYRKLLDIERSKTELYG